MHGSPEAAERLLVLDLGRLWDSPLTESAHQFCPGELVLWDQLWQGQIIAPALCHISNTAYVKRLRKCQLGKKENQAWKQYNFIIL